MQKKIAEFISLINNDSEVLDFLDQLAIPEKKALIPTIKKLIKESEYPDDGLEAAAFYCFSLKDFVKYYQALSENFYRFKVAYHFRPTWFNEIVNGRYFRILTFETVMEYMKNGWITPSPELICNTLPIAIRDDENYNTTTLLYLDAKILEKYIWYLFSNQSNIALIDSCTYAKDKSVAGWKYVLRSLSEKEEISRQRVLKESLLTVNFNFKKQLTDWFFSLFESLNPTEGELLSLQEELVNAFNSPFSKPINTSLKHIKVICMHTDFDTLRFLEAVPIILASDTKSVLNNSLTILDKIAKSHTDTQNEVCLLAIQALAFKEEKIQIKAAKLIVKHGGQAANLKEELSAYLPEVYSSAKNLLKDYLLENPKDVDEIELQEVLPKIRSDNKAPSYDSFSELIFFYSQAFDCNAIYDFDLFVGLLPKLDALITKDKVSLLSPAFQRALKTHNQRWLKKIGEIETQMALTFINYVATLFDRFPSDTKKMKSSYDKLVAEDRAVGDKYHNSRYYLVDIVDRDVTGFDGVYKVFKNRLAFAKKITLEQWDVPLLSMPTHLPCWIEPHTFVKRIKKYQSKERIPSLYDFQIAIMRLVFNDKRKIDLAPIQGEYKDMLNYLFNDQVALDLSLCASLSYWFIVVYRKGKLSDLQLFLDKFDKNEYRFLTPANWEVIVEIDAYDQSKTNTLKFEKKERNQSPQIDSFYHCLDDVSWTRPQDDEKMIFLSPSNPDFLFDRLIKEIKHSDEPTADDERSNLLLLTMLQDIWSDFGESTYFYIASTFVHYRKINRELVAEFWIQMTGQQRMNNILIGQILGRLEKNEFGVLKRFTNLLINRMFNVSKIHNFGLQELLENMIPAMNDVPIKGTKNLLEVYFELLQKNDVLVSEKVMTKLNRWQNVAALRKLLKKHLTDTE